MIISAEKVKELRESTGLGMMVCKKALMETEGDMEKAIENLRKQGQATAAKRAGKLAKEGKVSIVVQDDNALIYEVNSETDFVARNEDFLKFVEDLGQILINKKPADMDSARACVSESINGQTVGARILELIAKIGENISFRRFKIIPIKKDGQRVFSYIHNKGKIGVIAVLSSNNSGILDTETMSALGKDIAMQIAASNPIAVSREMIPDDIVTKEKEIYFTQAQSSGKPENIWDKIVEGKMNKFYKEVALLEQEFIRDTAISVKNRIKAAKDETGSEIEIVTFVRYELGSGE